MNPKPKFLATAIGSLPHNDPAKAVEVVLANVPEAPIWPQLPQLGLNEQMEVQYSEGMPSVATDHEKKRVYFDTANDYSEAFATFYEAYMAATEATAGTGDFSSMAISPNFSKGIYALESRLKAEGKKRPYIKVQTTGPCSFALTLTDENKRAIYYNEEFRDVIIKALGMKCRWQIQKFKPFGEQIICFIDEPILSAFGSSTYVSVKREDVVAHLKEVIEAVHAEGGLAGIHCCGNTEWSILVDAGVDILNFDAFGYGETIGMYPQAMKALLERGGAIAWGVVPWMRPNVTGEYAGWSIEPWPSTKIQSPISSACSTSHSQVPARKSEISRSTETPQPAIIMPVWPVGTKTPRRPASFAARSSSSATVIFPIAQSDPTVRITCEPGRCGRPTAVWCRSGTRR